MNRLCLGSGDMTTGSENDCVVVSSEILIEQNSGPSARELAAAGLTGYFGALTRKALAEYQKTEGIKPAVGYFGPVTERT